MNNLKKIGVSALAGSLAFTAAQATDFAVTGDAILKWTSMDSPKAAQANNGKGVGVDTDLYFNASGETDNGWTVSFFQAANTNTAWTNSSSQVTIGMGSMGTIQINNAAGAKANGIDDVMPAAYNETWDGLALAADNPSFFGGSTASGSVDYRIPAQEFEGATINASITYDPNADEAAPAAGGVGTTSNSGIAYTLQVAHESGVEIGGGIEDVETAGGAATAADEDSATAYVKYSNGPLSVGYQEAYQNTLNGGDDLEAQFWAIAYTAGDLSVSYGESSLENHGISTTAALETEMESIQASYTMGSMTIAGAISETSNAGRVSGQTHEETELSVSFAF
jgi:outer membrane protein OmpU